MLANLKDKMGRFARGIMGPGVAPERPAAARQPEAAPIVVLPITDIVCPVIDLRQEANPVATLFAHPTFQQTMAFFYHNPVADRSLVSNVSQALIYSLVRNLRPDHVFEIGTYRGGTTEAIARALNANGTGTVHTVSPFDANHFVPVFEKWPEQLQSRVRFHPIDSMDFYMRMSREKIGPGLAFIDGNHDYEFALFDIQCAARNMPPGGFIVVDNVSQAGPYYAARDFLRDNPAWCDLSMNPHGGNPALAFDVNRTGIPDTDLTVLRAPLAYVVGARPRTFGEIALPAGHVNGVALSLAAPLAGTLHVQCVLRGFGPEENFEVTGQTSIDVDGTSTELRAIFDGPITIREGFDRYRAEPWLIWKGDGDLALAAEPAIL